VLDGGLSPAQAVKRAETGVPGLPAYRHSLVELERQVAASRLCDQALDLALATVARIGKRQADGRDLGQRELGELLNATRVANKASLRGPERRRGAKSNGNTGGLTSAQLARQTRPKIGSNA
jgi:hypothetical protein